MTPPRHVRRNLERRADRVLDELRGTPVAVPLWANPRTHCILVSEGTDPVVVARVSLATVVDLGDLFAEIAAADDGERWAVLILIDGWMQVYRTPLTPLARGGAG